LFEAFIAPAMFRRTMPRSCFIRLAAQQASSQVATGSREDSEVQSEHTTHIMIEAFSAPATFRRTMPRSCFIRLAA
jgi:hypothetical protein